MKGSAVVVIDVGRYAVGSDNGAHRRPFLEEGLLRTSP
jgi:hypothetical protein